eukprot:533294_1
MLKEIFAIISIILCLAPIVSTSTVNCSTDDIATVVFTDSSITISCNNFTCTNSGNSNCIPNSIYGYVEAAELDYVPGISSSLNLKEDIYYYKLEMDGYNKGILTDVDGQILDCTNNSCYFTQLLLQKGNVTLDYKNGAFNRKISFLFPFSILILYMLIGIAI